MVVTQQHNGFEPSGHATLYRTTLDLDIHGNQRAVTDARAVTVATSVFDKLGRKLINHSVDAGDSSVLFDAMGATVHEWNPNRIEIGRDYDPLRRPTRVWVTEHEQERLAERIFYGETLAGTGGSGRNLRGRVFRELDNAGLVTFEYDFKGNLTLSKRRLTKPPYDQQVGWFDALDLTDPATLPTEIDSALEPEEWPTAVAYDALNRVKQLTVPSSSPTVNDTVVPTYNEAGLLETIGVQFLGAQVTPFVADIDYNERSQRTKVAYQNGATTLYSYEPDTFRLSTLTTTRGTNQLQALGYTYDPVGNVTNIHDAAQQTIFFANRIVEPSSSYTYDAIYRVITAVGREHAGQATPDQTAAPVAAPIPNPNDVQAMRQYSESYQYDQVGNLLAMLHDATVATSPTPGVFQRIWARTYTPDAGSNKLLSTSLSTATSVSYAHDDAGNMKSLGAALSLDWNYRSQLFHAGLGGGGDLYFTHNAAGQRVHRVKIQGSTIQERIYLGAYEIYRERPATGAATLERRTLHVDDGKRRVALVETLTVGAPATVNSINDGPAQIVRYQLDNHLGSAALELDETGKIISYEEYHPYGTTAYRATGPMLGTNPKRYAFTGKERDEDTGLYYFEARYYVPWLGRWASADPAGLVDGTVLFAYSRNNPIRFNDPQGRRSDDNTSSWADLGLRRADVRARYAEPLKDVRAHWDNYKTPLDRARALAGAVTPELTRGQDLGTGGVLAPEIVLQDPNLTRIGGFDPQKWELTINPKEFSFEKSDTNFNKKFAGAADTIVHELRHAEQSYRALEYAAGKGLSEKEIGRETGFSAKAIHAAARTPLPEGGLAADMGKRMYDLYVVDRKSTVETLSKLEPSYQLINALTAQAAARLAQAIVNPAAGGVPSAVDLLGKLGQANAAYKSALDAYHALPDDKDARRTGTAIRNLLRAR